MNFPGFLAGVGALMRGVTLPFFVFLGLGGTTGAVEAIDLRESPGDFERLGVLEALEPPMGNIDDALEAAKELEPREPST